MRLPRSGRSAITGQHIGLPLRFLPANLRELARPRLAHYQVGNRGGGSQAVLVILTCLESRATGLRDAGVRVEVESLDQVSRPGIREADKGGEEDVGAKAAGHATVQ